MNFIPKTQKPLQVTKQENEQLKWPTVLMVTGCYKYGFTVGKPGGKGTHSNSPERNKVPGQALAMQMEIKGDVGAGGTHTI